mmetsp:Transcript_75514/g.125918  ORF Transcript_75514/g.125918 Transcript_75514/m.125918 type:complete len:303 (-) Transcript_75514:344-1252(-)
MFSRICKCFQPIPGLAGSDQQALCDTLHAEANNAPKTSVLPSNAADADRQRTACCNSELADQHEASSEGGRAAMGSVAELGDVASVPDVASMAGVDDFPELEGDDGVGMTLASVVFDDSRHVRSLNTAHAAYAPSEVGAEAASEAAVEEAEEMEVEVDEAALEEGDEIEMGSPATFKSVATHDRNGTSAVSLDGKSVDGKASSEGGRADVGSIGGVDDFELDEGVNEASMTLASVVLADSRHGNALRTAHLANGTYAASEAGAEAASEAAVEEAEEMEMQVDDPICPPSNTKDAHDPKELKE